MIAHDGSAPRLACQDDPERWFDKQNRAYALERCLGCPIRPLCAQEALAAQASYGMWAGIWINSNLTDVAHHLRAIAHAPPRTEPAPVTESITLPATRPPGTTTPAGLAAPTPATAPTVRAVLAVILARSSGHCEVMTPVCRYTHDTVGSRIPGRSGWDATDPADVYAVCRPCQRALSSTEDRLLRQLGYIVDPPSKPTFTPLYWRQARWVYLDTGPTIIEVDRRITRADQAG